MSDPSAAALSFWTDLAERVVRQAQQTAVPILAALAATAPSGNLSATAGAIAATIAFACAVTVVKRLAEIRAGATAPLWQQVLDRTVGAAAGVLVGFVPTDVLGLAAVDWHAVGWATGATAVIALIGGTLSPPSRALP